MYNNLQSLGGDLCCGLARLVSACGGSCTPHFVAPQWRRACGPTGGGSGFAPYPSPPLAAPHPNPSACAPLRGHPAFCRLTLSCSARWAVLAHILERRVAVPRRTPVLLDGLAPPGRGRVPPSVLTDGLPPPARRVPPMHLAAHFLTDLQNMPPRLGGSDYANAWLQKRHLRSSTHIQLG